MKARNSYINYEFNGIVESVSYDDKNIPSATVDGQTYYLGATNWNFNRLIEAGDSLHKQKGNIVIELIKQKTGKILTFQ